MRSVPSIEPLKKELQTLKKVLLLLSSTPNVDSVAAALALSLALQKKGIDVHVASPSDMRVEFSRLVGVDGVKNKIGNRNLVISFEYSEDRVEKVSYNISEDGKRFNLVVAPKTGAVSLDPATVQYDHTGVDAEVVIMVGVSNFAELGPFYEEERNSIEGAKTVAITLFPAPTFANIHVDAQGFTSLCELMTACIVQLGLELETDSANNLMFGIDSITQSLTSPTVTADTFETVAALMRAGAKRQPMGQHGNLTPNQMPWQPRQTNVVPAPAMATPPTPLSANPFAAALQKSAVMPPGHSATGELKG